MHAMKLLSTPLHNLIVCVCLTFGFIFARKMLAIVKLNKIIIEKQKFVNICVCVCVRRGERLK